jgi:hypothetical protein
VIKKRPDLFAVYFVKEETLSTVSMEAKKWRDLHPFLLF